MIDTQTNKVKSELTFVAEGIFNGENMETKEGRLYLVPENYASKSKLIEGDNLKLYLTSDGRSLFKQTLPVPRKNGIGILIKDEYGYGIILEKRTYKVLKASVTYFKLEPNNKVPVVIPKSKYSQWAAINGPAINR